MSRRNLWDEWDSDDDDDGERRPQPRRWVRRRGNQKKESEQAKRMRETTAALLDSRWEKLQEGLDGETELTLKMFQEKLNATRQFLGDLEKFGDDFNKRVLAEYRKNLKKLEASLSEHIGEIKRHTEGAEDWKTFVDRMHEEHEAIKRKVQEKQRKDMARAEKEANRAKARGIYTPVNRRVDDDDE